MIPIRQIPVGSYSFIGMTCLFSIIPSSLGIVTPLVCFQRPRSTARCGEVLIGPLVYSRKLVAWSTLSSDNLQLGTLNLLMTQALLNKYFTKFNLQEGKTRGERLYETFIPWTESTPKGVK